ncbi:MAG: hypothetical protein ABFD50_22995 [Smithella sp.]
MKKALAYITCTAFLLSAIAFAADKPAFTAAAGDSSKISNVKVTKMNARGKVVEITDKTIKIERRVKHEVEIMEFVLDKPVENIAVNDFVKIVYVENDGSLLASRVVKIIPKKTGKKEATSKKPATLK